MSTQAAENGLSVQRAHLDELLSCVSIINEAYEVECGSSGVSFKKEGVNRFNNPEAITEFKQSIIDEHVLTLKDQTTQELLGVVSYEIRDTTLFFGPYATKYRGKGLGMVLYRELERMAQHDLKMEKMALVVVNHRTELISMYGSTKFGFVVVGEAPYPNTAYLTRDCHFIKMEKSLRVSE
jgi:ribosomal protein S18 acetylase RimI-like enzyme